MHLWLCTHIWRKNYLRKDGPSSFRQRKPHHQTSQGSKSAALFAAMCQAARQNHPKKTLPTSQRGSGCSVHEKPTTGRCDHLPAHGALPQLLTTVALAAHHVAAGHQDHGWTMFVADGARHTGATAGCGTLLWAGGSCIFGGPLAGKKGTVAVAGIRPKR
jgi:hypothetical protein